MATEKNNAKRISLLQRGFYVKEGPVDVAEVVKVDYSINEEKINDKLKEFFGKIGGLYYGKTVALIQEVNGGEFLWKYYYYSKDGSWKPK